MRTRTGAAIAAALALTTGAAAQNWNETTDAGDVVGVFGHQTTVGQGPLTTITGWTDVPGGDWIDAYSIVITDPSQFYATTDPTDDANAAASFDTRLWLFNLDGTPVSANDDTPTGTTLGSYISDISTHAGGQGNGAAVSPLQAGATYILAIGGFGNDPMDGVGTELISIGSQWTELHGPNPAAGALANWQNLGFHPYGTYTIALRGATFSFIPSPGALTLLLLGAPALARRRR